MPALQNIPAEEGKPVYKVGLVVLRDAASADPQVLMAQVKPKREGDVPDFSLPKGTRKYSYRGETGKKRFRDAKDASHAVMHERTLEPLHRTLMAEADEEAGINRRLLRRADMFELGPREFASRKGEPFPIHWFAMEADAHFMESMNPNPRDAQAVRWVKFSELAGLVEKGEAGQAAPGECINRSYLEVAQEALDGYRAGTLTRFAIPFGPQAVR